MTDVPRLLTVHEVADLLGVSCRYVREELIGGGRLRAVRFKKRGAWHVCASSVEKLVSLSGERNRSEDYSRQRAEAARRRLGYQQPAASV